MGEGRVRPEEPLNKTGHFGQILEILPGSERHGGQLFVVLPTLLAP